MQQAAGSPGWIVSLSTFFLVVGQIAAILLMAAISWPSVGENVSITKIAAIMTFIPPACSLIFLDEKNSSSVWGAILPGQDGADEKAGIAKGRNKERAAEELHLARETVKTHTANIYRKLAIHSQQELIDLVEGLE